MKELQLKKLKIHLKLIQILDKTFQILQIVSQRLHKKKIKNFFNSKNLQTINT